ncbi:Nuclear pore protein-like protein [Apiospora sp. TS-2023a]
MASFPTPCPRTPEEPALKVMDADGDLLLKVGTTKCTTSPAFSGGPHLHDVVFTFQVCSRTLARSSPVWKKMLFGGFAESKPKEGDWIVSLPDDSPEAMSTLLGIIHAKFEGVPLLNHLITSHDLFNLTVLTDKYDLTHILRPWARTWLDCVWDTGSTTFKNHLELLWIAWELGDQERFTLTASSLAQNMQDRAVLECALTPPEVTETILKLHYAAIDSLFRPFEGLLHSLSHETTDFMFFEKHAHPCVVGHSSRVNQPGKVSKSDECNLLTLGYFTRAFRKSGLHLGALSPRTVTELANDLEDAVSNVPHLEGHKKCCAARYTGAKIEAVVREVTFTPTKLHIEHLQAQAIKSGLSRQ